MWQFLSENPTYAWCLLGLIFFVFIVLLIISKDKKMPKIKKANLFGNEIEFGDKESKKDDDNIEGKDSFSEEDKMRDALILCSSITQWQKTIDKIIDYKTKEVINSSIRYANNVIDTNANRACLEYGAIIRETKKEITQEDNYQIIISGFLVDQVREELKNIVCTAIREDHFETKSPVEIESISEDATARAHLIFNSKKDVLNPEIMEKISEKYSAKIKTEVNNIISLTAEKYKNLKTEIQKTIEEETEQFKDTLRLKFPEFSSDSIDNIVSYYN